MKPPPEHFISIVTYTKTDSQFGKSEFDSWQPYETRTNVNKAGPEHLRSDSFCKATLLQTALRLPDQP